MNDIEKNTEYNDIEENNTEIGENAWDELMGPNYSLANEVDTTLHNEKTASGTDVILNTLSEYLPKEQKLNKRLKMIFSIILLIILIMLTVFLIGIIVYLGLGKLKFDEITLRLVITGIFAEVIGIIKIMVSSIFPEDDKKLLYDFIKNCAGDK
ncbi:hypothetical protein [Clostridium botulinum]|uniref:hypothetical protein n=1 Tax=Clostridium botulinum TaxID=1491 RepID=UPI001C9AC190|nr:hypothetical protein [Clostridium botulinum]MBY6898090.1 hypothetical protein [Clostridium botulinum]MBY6913283.1 hypothetical protein [Clostridium botulinum]